MAEKEFNQTTQIGDRTFFPGKAILSDKEEEYLKSVEARQEAAEDVDEDAPAPKTRGKK